MRRFIKIGEVKKRTAKSRSGIYRDMHAGIFPWPVKNGVHGVAWVEDEIDALVESKIAARDAEHDGDA